ncbi:alpha-N-acetylneuraminide alpha-2,8-sialyltransferase-like isoform X2 [Eublepharis macularius]|uniref:Alpha-N-acetylneuraminide alpha-2,8-sialyltransferase-like isoform X2 n=1 Tax=Eublepharis macularius TaxID=481883 RepID=A0AA97K5K0_EUBMA|nr:alpha-N-acetylneuraminide alpha-2,8-sialyltransferase-like isoform X2 [Eublepharis macularius]
MYLDLRPGKRKIALGICVVFFISLTLSLMQRTNRDQAIPQPLAKCWKLKELLGTGNVLEKSILNHMSSSDKELVHAVEKWPLEGEDRKILAQLLLTQECPSQPNATALAQYRAELGQCCNASFWLAVTKENTPLGSDILLDGNAGKKIKVKTELMDLLPKRSPFSGIQYDQCAVVGNGGILQNSSCGQEIDQADLIVRFNLPLMNCSVDVGTKTGLVTLNPSILQEKFKNLQARRKPFADALSPYSSALVFIPAFSFVGHSDLSYRALYTMEDFGMMQRAYFLNPHYLSALKKHWKDQGFHPPRLSSGFMLISVALELCKHITLYGFWPFPHDLADQPIPHHYYDNVMPKRGMHAMPSEFSHYLRMYAQGVLQIRLGKCW